MSLSFFALLLGGIFAIYTGLLDLLFAVPVLIALAFAVLLRYGAFYHRFTKSTYRIVVLLPLTGAAIVSGAGAYGLLAGNVTRSAVRRVLRGDPSPATYEAFLPDWWIGIVLLAAGLLVLFGLLVTRDTDPYPKPTDIRGLARSPVYFGVACGIFGLWAVLFVGVGVQRVVIIAPLFEELLKFGVALLIASTLFGRSTAARIGVAAVVGLLFGVIEHATTYPTEPDAVYLYRSLFHMATTMLSVSAYTMFEATEQPRLQWIAPAISVCLHFFYNTFAVLSGVIAAVVFGADGTGATLVYGGLAVTLCVVLMLLAVRRHRAVSALYRPLADVLSDLG